MAKLKRPHRWLERLFAPGYSIVWLVGFVTGLRAVQEGWPWLGGGIWVATLIIDGLGERRLKRARLEHIREMVSANIASHVSDARGLIMAAPPGMKFRDQRCSAGSVLMTKEGHPDLFVSADRVAHYQAHGYQAKAVIGGERE